MSSIIVCISNNLKHDMRVLRQVGTFAEAFDKVIVCARPIPDRTEHYQADNVEWVWFENDVVPDEKRIRRLAKKYGVYEELISIAPVILDDNVLGKSENIEFERRIQEIQMSHRRWDEVGKGIPAEATDDEQVYWLLFNIDLILQWADLVTGIDADIIYCNDYDTLLCGVAHKKVKGSRLIYDEHDLYCDSFPYLFPAIYRSFIALFEYEFLKHADAMISVSEAAVGWLKETYDLTYTPLFVPNCKDVHEDLPAGDTGIDYPIRLYFQGFADAGKGLGEVIEAIKHTDEAVLHLRCLENEYVAELKEYVSENDLGGKVRFFDPVSPHDVIAAARTDGDIGLTISVGETSIGIRNTITNKLIEYLTAGLPVIVSEEMRDQSRIVGEYDAGFVVGKDIRKELPRILDDIRKDPGLISTMSGNAKKAANEIFRWENYKDRFIELVCGGNEGSKPAEAQQSIPYDDLLADMEILRKQICLIMENRNEIVIEKKKLEIELQELKASNSWRIGRAFTRPARMIKKQKSGYVDD